MDVVVGPRPHEASAVSQRGLSQKHRKACVRSDRRGLQERRSCSRLIARTRPRVTERDHQPAAFLGNVSRLPVKRTQSERIQPRRLLVCEQCDGTISRPLRVTDGAGGICARQRFEEMVRKLREVRLLIRRVQTLEDLARTQVRRSPAARR